MRRVFQARLYAIEYRDAIVDIIINMLHSANPFVITPLVLFIFKALSCSASLRHVVQGLELVIQGLG